MDIKNRKIDIFDVYTCEDMDSFIYVEISDKTKLFDTLFAFFFSEITLFEHFRTANEPLYEPTIRNYVSLYKNLKLFIDEENVAHIKVESITDEIRDILDKEGMLKIEGEHTYIIRNDKVGKIGEYLFSILLEKYYDCDCIIPKTRLTTDPNMNVYGIDTLHYSRKNRSIMFGESKFTTSLESGVSLLKESLVSYETQLRDEYTLILSNKFLKLNVINEMYGNEIGLCMTFEKFLEEAKIDKIGIPLFVAHGGTVDDKETIFKKLNTIKRTKFFGKDTVYTIISLPVISKSEILKRFTEKTTEMLGEIYERAR